MNNNKKCKTLLISFIPYFLLLTLITLSAIEKSKYINFSPLNGDFQNFNPVRRLLAGQAPFRDFEVYLGMGHLIMGGLFTLIGGVPSKLPI